MTRKNAGTTMELLAPAGGREQLEYAIRFGADAVYLALRRFGMRRRAANFADEDLPQIVSYAHERGVDVHVAANVVMHQSDLVELPGFFELLERSQVDAAIVSDLGALRIARRHAPSVALHVSTQASVANAEAALAWYELGARRVVCAREMSVEQIALMHASIPDDLELEAFAHGSMCMSYSGRCMISDFLTGRGANDGNCTQPCRWSWSLHEPTRPGQEFVVEEDEDATYILNSRDMNMLAHLDDLARAGIDSIKLEGRGRKAFYVATVVNAYRQVLDGADPLEFAGELEAVSHHPYSTGFYYGPAHQAPDSGASDQLWNWAAEVVSCTPSPDAPGGFDVEVIARNRFDTGSELEVISPHRRARGLRVSKIRWVHEDDEGLRVVDEVPCANRQMDHYILSTDAELLAHDIIRARVATAGASC